MELGEKSCSHNTRGCLMRTPHWVHPGVWGVILGAVGMMIGGFAWPGSDRAMQINIRISRAFTHRRELLETNEILSAKRAWMKRGLKTWRCQWTLQQSGVSMEAFVRTLATPITVGSR
jgi:hypothetical protein